MVKEAKANSRLSNNLLLIILVVLILLIIGLIIGIVVGNINKSNEGGGGTDGSGATASEVIGGATAGGGYTDYRPEEISELSQQAEETEDVEAGKEVFENYINNASESINKELAKVSYGKYLIKEGRLNNNQTLLDEGLGQLQNVNPDGFDAEQQMAHLGGFRDYYEAMDNEELYNEYNNRIRDVISNSDLSKGGV